MPIENVRTGDVRRQETCDPRTRLVQEKFFTLRPKPLEQWLWRKGVSASAERVFWFHWSEGARSGDWCSQVALHYVAEACGLDTSTVTRAYQALKRLGLLRRTDPGRDPGNPFQQATAVTEVLLPRELLMDLAAFPNRPRRSSSDAPVAAPPVPVQPVLQALEPPSTPSAPAASPKERRQHLNGLLACLSESERARYNEAFRTQAPGMTFDVGTAVTPEQQAEIQSLLATFAKPRSQAPSPASRSVVPTGPRRLSVFDLARLRRELQRIVGKAEIDELARQVLWALEEGALRKFGTAHGINIALKKLRDGQWTRPHRMPPNWVRRVSQPA